MKNRKMGSVVAFSILLLLFLCSCGEQGNVESSQNSQSANDSQEATSVQPVEVETEEVPDSSEVASPETPFTADTNADLKVVASFIYDNETYVVVENVGEQAILNFRVAYINFDNNGFVTTTDSNGYESGKYDTANLMPGEKLIAAWYGAKGNYSIATICGIDYADGTTWEMEQVDRWAEDSRQNFDVDEQKAKISELKGIANLADSNEFATLTEIYIKHENQFSSYHDFHFSVQNISNQGITKLNVFVLEFDENGFPVSVSPYDTYCLNGHQTSGTVNLAAGQSGSYSDDLFLSSTTTQIKAVISYLEFQDGTEWENPYIYEWIIANNSAY